MGVSDWIGLIGLVFTLSGAVVWATLSAARKETGRQVHEARLADAIDALTAKLDKVVEAIEHLDGRVDDHDKKIALLEQDINR